METNQAPSAPVSPNSNAPGNSGQANESHAPTAKEITQAFEGKNPPPKPTQQQQPPASEKPKAPELHELTVNGKKMKVSLDELKAYASKSHAADMRFEEASKKAKQAEKILQTFANKNSNPIPALLEQGFSKEEIRSHIEAFYKEQYIDPEQLSPEQRRAQELEKELEGYKKKDKELQEKTQKEEQEKLTSQQREYLQTQIVEALEGSELPKSPWVVQRMAFYMRQNLANGWDAPMDLIVRQVNSDRMQLMGDISENASAEQLIKMLGDGVINKIRKHDLEQLRAKRQFPQPGTQSEPKEPQGRMSMSEVNQRLNDMRRGKF